ncbi:AAA domain-containing protein [Dethiothermospora halolimnae]|uniref:AAA domain-containing protein n=1 Tax=Dethiothermospora halolimnae TaxID=3114390 RepID=UPI003CCBBEA3
MKAIFSKYKERLINLSSRNRSLVLKKLYKKRSFDLYRLNEFIPEFLENIVSTLLDQSTKKVLMLEDPYEKRIREIKKLEKRLDEEKKEKLLKAEEKYSEPIELEKIKKSINEAQAKVLTEEVEKIEKEVNKLIDYSTSLKYLDREIKSTEKESGRYELYVGYPFVEGRFQDNTFVRAPILLFPVKISKSNNKWYIQNIKGQEILINKVFLFAYAKYNEIKLKDFDTEFNKLAEFDNDIIEELLNYLNENKIKIQDTGTRKVEKFLDYTNKNLPKYNIGELILKNHMVLGQFPISNSIYTDYQYLEKKDINHKLLSKLLLNRDDDICCDDVREREDKQDEKIKISEKNTYYLTSLDYSQEKAIDKVNNTDELVIYGPPGTGKSQTIANLVTDALCKGKRVLMVSQKRAALDVIYNRLSSLNSKVILLHDANKGKKAFYEKVAQVIEDFNISSNMDPQEDITDKSDKINKEIKRLEDIAITLHKPREFGLTLQQMYTKTKKIISKEDLRYDLFKSFRKNNQFKDYRYDELKEAIDKLKRGSIINTYIEYKNMKLKNNMLSKLDSNFDYLEAQEISDVVEGIVDKSREILNKRKEKTTFEKLVKLFINNDYSITEKELMNLVNEINKSENSGLLVPLNNGRWWSLSYWLDYRRNKKKELENKEEYNKRGKNKEQEIKKFYKLLVEGRQSIDIVKDILKEEGYFKVIKEFFNNSEELTNTLNKIVQGIEDYESYRKIYYTLSTVGNLEKDILEYGFINSSNKEELEEAIDSLLEFIILIKISDIEKSEEKRHLYDCLGFNEITKDIKNLMNEKNKLTPELLVNKWNKKMNYSMEQRNFREFKRQANKKRALWPIRKYVTEFSDIVFDVFPCWLLGPETVSDILPLKSNLFDLIIFDEASQIFIENAIPTIYRGEKVVVAGDDKQLKPSSMFKSKYNDIEEDEMSIETAAAFEEESLLDLAKVNYDSAHLNYHYRSQYDQLINFSNYAFYNGKLQVSPNVINTTLDNRPIERVKVDGKWIDRKNIVEAEEVVELIGKIFENRKENETIGIITFNINQKDLIEDLLEKRANEDPKFKTIYSSEINRKDGDEDVSLFVKNIENVQGDERDIVIFSIGYAPNENGKVSVNFGALSQDGGENRLNVAISRAKKKIYVITSIEPEILKIDHTKNIGPKLFKKYLQYVREISNNNGSEAKKLLNSFIDSNIERNEKEKYDSDFEIEVHDALVNLGYDVDTQVGVSGYKIDLAIYDEKTSRYILGIECDGATYHSSKSARERDIHRQRYLESRGWKIIRIWSRDWWKDSKAEIKKIDKLIKTYCPSIKMGDIHKTNQELIITKKGNRKVKEVDNIRKNSEKNNVLNGDKIVSY